MPRQPNGFWTKRRTLAAQLVAEDKLTDAEIAARCRISRRGLERWKTEPAFQTRVAEIVEAERQAVLAKGIADRQNRIDALNDRWQRMQRVIEARAADPEIRKAPGGDTGLIVLKLVLVKLYEPLGDDGLAATGQSILVNESAVDVGLLKQLLETEKQSAQELGQWTEKRELTGKDGGPLDIRTRPDLTKLSDEELGQLEQLLGKTADVGRGAGGEGTA